MKIGDIVYVFEIKDLANFGFMKLVNDNKFKVATIYACLERPGRTFYYASDGLPDSNQVQNTYIAANEIYLFDATYVFMDKDETDRYILSLKEEKENVLEDLFK